MKQINYITILFFSLLLASCDYLDIVPSEVITEENIFSDIKTAEDVLGHLYWTNYYDNRNGLERESFNSQLISCTDEAKNHWESQTSTVYYNYGGCSITDNPLNEWAFDYHYIRMATLFINHIDNVPIPSSLEATYSTRVKQYKEEARFFRAQFYFDLFRQFGAVPLVTSLLDLNDVEGTKIPRNSCEEIIDYVISELDEAASVLPDVYSTIDYGRITKGTCLFLKARVLLYAASPLFNGNTLYANLKNADGKQLFPQTYDAEKWKTAAEAFRDALDWAEGVGGIKMYSPNTSNTIDTYEKLFYNNSTNTEIVFPIIIGTDQALEYPLNPNGADYSGWGKFSVLQEMVDAYETSSGYLPFEMNDDGVILYDENGQPSINAESGYSEDGFWNGKLWDGSEWITVENISNMYKDRDPRFYASINFHNDAWKYNMVNRTLHYSYWLNPTSSNFDGWPKSGTNCESGYNVRKFLDPAVNLKLSWSISHNYPLFRMAELYLGLAEALNEYYDNPTQEVYDAINMVRNRVGMPGLPVTAEDETKIGMRKRIRNEWRVEFFYENHRFWDVRRWMIAEQVDNGDVYGMNTRPEQSEIETAAADAGLDMDVDEDRKTAGTLVYYKRTLLQTRTFLPKHYLFPIPQDEIDKNANLVQNYGW